jgi:phytoene dehydrogenase-like protein
VIIGLIADNLRDLGGRLRTGALVEKILVERDTAVGVRLASSETIAADWVISTANGHATTDKLLGGLYGDWRCERSHPQSLSLVSAGLARRGARSVATARLHDPGSSILARRFRSLRSAFCHFDPSFAAPGKTAVT